MPTYKRAGPRNLWPDRTRGLQTQRLFSTIQDFWRSSDAVGLSQVSKVFRLLTGQISAHYPSSKIRNSYLRLFRPDQGPHTVPQNTFIAKFPEKGNTQPIDLLNLITNEAGIIT